MLAITFAILAIFSCTAGTLVGATITGSGGKKAERLGLRILATGWFVGTALAFGCFVAI